MAGVPGMEENLAFTWSVISIKENELKIQVSFKYPDEISAHGEADCFKILPTDEFLLLVEGGESLSLPSEPFVIKIPRQ